MRTDEARSRLEAQCEAEWAEADLPDATLHGSIEMRPPVSSICGDVRPWAATTCGVTLEP